MAGRDRVRCPAAHEHLVVRPPRALTRGRGCREAHRPCSTKCPRNCQDRGCHLPAAYNHSQVRYRPMNCGDCRGTRLHSRRALPPSGSACSDHPVIQAGSASRVTCEVHDSANSRSERICRRAGRYTSARWTGTQCRKQEVIQGRLEHQAPSAGQRQIRHRH